MITAECSVSLLPFTEIIVNQGCVLVIACTFRWT